MGKSEMGTLLILNAGWTVESEMGTLLILKSEMGTLLILNAGWTVNSYRMIFAMCDRSERAGGRIRNGDTAHFEIRNGDTAHFECGVDGKQLPDDFRDVRPK
jgi:hypothetical protein